MVPDGLLVEILRVCRPLFTLNLATDVKEMAFWAARATWLKPSTQIPRVERSHSHAL
ncbi:MAG TPA: hypothetical protein V6C98_09045 [Thermosynechococcaceae cyanobacterium]